MEALPVASWQMWLTFATIAVAVGFYAAGRVSMELTSLFTVGSLMVFFHLFPVTNAAGDVTLSTSQLLSGFASPALFAILALLVIGQGLFISGALEGPTRFFARIGSARPVATLVATLLLIAFVSAFMNNTPVAVMFIPVLATLAGRMRQSPSKVMIPLSYVCILGGMTTLIGSSTNLLAAGIVESIGLAKISFFDFTIPGLALATVGLIYVFIIAPRLLPERETFADEMSGAGKQYIAQIQLAYDHPLVGTTSIAGLFPPLKEVTIRMIQRGETPILPPYEDITLQPGDTLIMAATRQTLTDALKSGSSLFKGLLEQNQSTYYNEPDTSKDDETEEDGRPSGDLTLVEVVVAPASRMIGRNIEQIGFRHESGCIVLGIQRRSRMIRSKMNDIRLEDGDVLLILGSRNNVHALRLNRDVIPLEWSATELPDLSRSTRARVIFGITVTAAVFGLVPIEVASLVGAAFMIGTGVLNIRQASRAIDRRIFLLVGAALAMGTALQGTGGAAYLAQQLVSTLSGFGPTVILSAMFLFVAVLTNILTNNATAVLFVPIAVSTAQALNVDPMVFVYAVIFAANCSFATPMGYQTNLLVMGPGHYKFGDYLRTGVPLIILLWITYTLFAPWYYGL